MPKSKKKKKEQIVSLGDLRMLDRRRSVINVYTISPDNSVTIEYYWVHPKEPTTVVILDTLKDRSEIYYKCMINSDYSGSKIGWIISYCLSNISIDKLSNDKLSRKEDVSETRKL